MRGWKNVIWVDFLRDRIHFHNVSERIRNIELIWIFGILHLLQKRHCGIDLGGYTWDTTTHMRGAWPLFCYTMCTSAYRLLYITWPLVTSHVNKALCSTILKLLIGTAGTFPYITSGFNLLNCLFYLSFILGEGGVGFMRNHHAVNKMIKAAGAGGTTTNPYRYLLLCSATGR